MSKAVIMPTFNDFESLKNLLEQLSDYEGQVIVVDGKPDHEKKHLVRHMVRHNVYLPLGKEANVTEVINKYLQNVQRKWILIVDGGTEPPLAESLDKMSLYDTD